MDATFDTAWHLIVVPSRPPVSTPGPLLMADILTGRCDRPELLRLWDEDRRHLNDACPP